MRRLIFLFVLSLLALPVLADEGYMIRGSSSGVNSPRANQTILFDSSDKNLKFWNGSSWIKLNVPPSNWTAESAPSSENDETEGYQQGSIWLDTALKQVYVCGDPSEGAAEWHPITSRIAAVNIRGKLTTADIATNWIVSGLIGAVPEDGLELTTPSGIAVVQGQRIEAGPFTHTYAEDSDTYEYLQSDGTILRVAVPNDDPAPVGQPGLPIQKIVSGELDITSVVQLTASLPRLRVAEATNSNHAINLGQATSLFAPSSIAGSQSQNTVFAAPDGSSGAGVFRSLVSNDLPASAVQINQGNSYSAETEQDFTVSQLRISLSGDADAYDESRGSLWIHESKLRYVGDEETALTHEVAIADSHNNFSVDQLPSAPGAAALGDSETPWADLFLGSDDTNNVHIAPAALTAPRNFVLPDADSNPVIPSTAPSNQFANGVSSGGVLSYAQPSFSNLSGSATVAQGGTGVTSAPANGQLLIGNGTGYSQATITPGTGISVLNESGSITITSTGATGGFGGDGSDGSVTKGAVTETTMLQINSTNFTQSASTTYVPVTGSVFNSTGTQTWSGTTNVGPAYPAATEGRPGGGPSGGLTRGNASGGGGNAGDGGNSNDTGNTGGFGGVRGRPSRYGGSGGAGGTNGDAGGTGGGGFVACAIGSITIGGSINANGGNGGGATKSSGGGSGGTIYIASQHSVVLNGSLSATGGTTTDGTNPDGGAGGGGYVIRHAPTFSGSGSVTVTGGAAAGSGQAGGAGINLQISGTPNLPLLVYTTSPEFKEDISPLVLIAGRELKLSQNEVSALAAKGDIVKMFALRSDTGMTTSSVIGIGDFVEVPAA